MGNSALGLGQQQALLESEKYDVRDLECFRMCYSRGSWLFVVARGQLVIAEGDVDVESQIVPVFDKHSSAATVWVQLTQGHRFESKR